MAPHCFLAPAFGLVQDHTTVKLAQCTKTFRAGTGVAFQAAKTLTSVKADLTSPVIPVTCKLTLNEGVAP